MAVLTRDRRNEMIDPLSQCHHLSVMIQNENRHLMMVGSKKNSCGTLPSRKKFVRFSDVTLREYPMVVGDNPAVSSGPPVTIDWNYMSEVVISVDQHQSVNRNPRRQQDMILPSYVRKMILIENGALDIELEEAEDEAIAIKLQRHKSLKGSKLIFRLMVFHWIRRKLQEVLSK